MKRLLGALVLAMSSSLDAQLPQSEIRVDAVGPEPYAVHAGIGLTWALGTYARVGVVGGYGARGPGDDAAKAGRVDLIARVTLDPFRQQKVGLSLGGGLTVRERPYLVAIVDFEGPAIGPVVPALQIGVGFGYRAGLVLRRTMPNRR